MASKKKTVATAVTPVGLAAIIAASAVAPGFLMVSKVEGDKLAAEGLIELNPAIVDGNMIAARATQKGIDSMATKNEVAAAPAASNEFVIEDSVAIPAISGRGRVGSVYPFDKMNVGQSFFVAKPAKNLASTVSSANARYAEVIPGEFRKAKDGSDVAKTKLTRQFIVRSVEGGSRIWRKA